MRGLAWLAAVVALSWGCSGPSGRPIDGGGDGGGGGAADADGDGISDHYEGRAEGVDTDGDGTPDYLDDDSDGDGVPDSAEAGTTISGDPPRDADGDATPDFRDDDSDGNGILDATEGGADFDGDGIVDSSDTDNDGDRILDTDEIGGDPAAPIDFDVDGGFDYADIDSDGDGIGDLYESTVDSDADGAGDRLDADSDDDGWTDAEESGLGDPTIAPPDTDDDGIFDFRDLDSDGDGLADSEERTLGTARDNADTDGDGVSDLVEVSACPDMDPVCAMDATDPTSSPRTRGDFVFAEPYEMPPMPLRDTLDFATDLRVADVYFLVDTTGSMGGAITNVRTSLSTPTTGIIDQVRAIIPDTWFGVGGFDDYQVAPYGYESSCDRAYYNLQDLTSDPATAQAAVNRLVTHFGGDGAESLIPGLYATASGLGLMGMSGWTYDRAAGGDPPPAAGASCYDPPAFTACPAGSSIGWPCFRDGAVPIVVAITDIYTHNGPGGSQPYTVAGSTTAPDYAATIAALTAARVKVIGVAVGTLGEADLRQIATDTGAVDGAGMPLVSTGPAGSVSSAVVDQIRTLANQTPIDISVVYEDDASDGVDTWAAFVDHLEANEAGDAARGCDPRDAEDTDGDGYPDTFMDVTPGNRVCFDIIVKQNDTVMPLPTPQLFRATLRVLGDGFTELDSRDVFFLVPPDVGKVGPG